MSISRTDSAETQATNSEVLSYEEHSSLGDRRKLIRAVAVANIIIGGASLIGSVSFAAVYTLGKLDQGYSNRSFSMDLLGSETVGIINSVLGMIASLVIVLAAVSVLRGALVATSVLAAAAVVPVLQTLLSFVSFRLQEQMTSSTGSAYEIAMMVYDNTSGLVWVAQPVAVVILNFAAYKAARGR